eukprot:TRINITY_DN3522_c0_g1_i15.p3 TRINITY_DN3522_c0_g1~~TRINITY_DN3522_c0_g1_i15.p3  ORF type:complete len:125 (-),score=53.94 TRINITY_DN3522_c0_g1_i15:396-770(-)
MCIRDSVYPIHCSVKNLTAQTKDNQWISYWVIFSIITFVDTTFYISKLPGYCLLKPLFCFWLVHPDYLGASYLQVKIINPIFNTFRPLFDPYMLKLHEVVSAPAGAAKPVETAGEKKDQVLFEK